MAGRCSCPQTCNCCSGSSESVAVVGTGTIGQCFTPAVIYSAEDGNRARAGGDGGVYADTCLLAPDGSTIEPGPTGCVQVPAACIKNVGGDPIAPDGDGCVQLPASTPPAYACGLSEDEEGVLSVSTGVWPGEDINGTSFAGPIDAATNTYCDPDNPDGEVRGMPEHTVITERDADTILAPDLIPVDDHYETIQTLGVSIINPSTARRMLTIAHCTLVVDLSAPADSGALVKIQARVNAGAWEHVRTLRWPETSGDGPTIRSALELTADVTDNIGAGDAWLPEIRCQVVKDGVGDDPVLISVDAEVVAEGRTI